MNVLIGLIGGIVAVLLLGWAAWTEIEEWGKPEGWRR